MKVLHHSGWLATRIWLLALFLHSLIGAMVIAGGGQGIGADIGAIVWVMFYGLVFGVIFSLPIWILLIVVAYYGIQQRWAARKLLTVLLIAGVLLAAISYGIFYLIIDDLLPFGFIFLTVGVAIVATVLQWPYILRITAYPATESAIKIG
jgi:hypothetical protein